MERFLGIGGIFFKARHPQSLAVWYRDHLGIPIATDRTDGAFMSSGPAEPTVWATFPADTEYFAASSAPFMLNYRVLNLDAMLAQLRAAGARVEDRVEKYDYGRFG